jgi:hypothetical protein
MKGTYLTYKAWLAAVRKAGAVRLDGDKDIATAFDSKGKGVGEWDGAEGYLYKGKSVASVNPKGVYTTYSAWRAAAKKAGAMRFEGDKDIAQAFDANGRGVAEWDGAEGYIYRKSEMRNPRNSGDDPSRDEMIEHIRKVYGREADEFDIEEAIYWFASDYHGGQGSNLYSALSTSEYRPGRMSSGPEEGSMGEMIYSDLVETFSTKKNPVKPRKGESSRSFVSRCMSEEKSSFPKTKQRIAVCLSKSRKRNPAYDTGSDE